MNNIWFTWGDVFNSSLQSLWWGFIQFAPKLIIAIVFFIIGWVLGSLVAKAFEHVFSALKIDKLFQSIKEIFYMILVYLHNICNGTNHMELINEAAP